MKLRQNKNLTSVFVNKETAIEKNKKLAAETSNKLIEILMQRVTCTH